MSRTASLGQVWRSRNIVVQLAWAQLRDRYAASALGVIWALAQPAMTMGVFWFVFVYGLKLTTPSGQVPFVWMLLVGLTAWFYFNDALTSGIQAVTGHAYLVRKIALPLEILPLAPIIASLVIHLVLLVLIVGALALAGEFAGWRALLLPFYLVSVTVLATGLSYWLAALQVFYRDVAQTASVLLQIWFWLTPIVWSADAIAPSVLSVLSWNPLYFIVLGYRYCLLAGISEPPGVSVALAFWLVTTVVLISGIHVYRRLEGEFADVL